MSRKFSQTSSFLLWIENCDGQNFSSFWLKQCLYVGDGEKKKQEEKVVQVVKCFIFSNFSPQNDYVFSGVVG